MPFEVKTTQDVIYYVTRDIADEAWHVDFFRFISDVKLAQRLGEEFISTRCMYKILEGLAVTKWMLRAQVRQQVMSYASIYEAVLHHLLFSVFSADPKVLALKQQMGRNDVSIPPAKLALLQSHLSHGGKPIYVTQDALKKVKETSIRFDKKAECARDLGLINQALMDDLIEFYEARNAIHIHAEIRKSLKYQIALSVKAYRRMEPFKNQIEKGLVALGIATSFPARPGKSMRPKPSLPAANTALP